MCPEPLLDFFVGDGDALQFFVGLDFFALDIVLEVVLDFFEPLFFIFILPLLFLPFLLLESLILFFNDFFLFDDLGLGLSSLEELF